MFIQTEVTPNPDTLKFLPGQTVMGDGGLDLRSKDEAQSSPLAQQLFDIENVSGVYFGRDFISITKSDGDWAHLKPLILTTIMDHFVSEKPLFFEGQVPVDGATDEEFFAPNDKETVQTIKELLETRIRPAVASDGGDITFQGFRDGIVYLKMKGACAGCPSSTATLRYGIQNLLRHFLPEVQEVRSL